MKRLAAFLAGLSLFSCTPEMNKTEEIDVAVYLDESVPDEKAGGFIEATHKSLDYLTMNLEKAEELTEKKIHFKVFYSESIPFGGHLCVLDLELLNQFVSHVHPKGDINIGFSAAFNDFLGLAHDYGGRYAVVRSNLEKDALDEVIAHELGHTFGLYHNSSGVMSPFGLGNMDPLEPEEISILADYYVSFLKSKVITRFPSSNPSPFVGLGESKLKYLLVGTGDQEGIQMYVTASGTFNVQIMYGKDNLPFEDLAKLNSLVSELKRLDPAFNNDVFFYDAKPYSSGYDPYGFALAHISADYFLRNSWNVLASMEKYGFIKMYEVSKLEEKALYARYHHVSLFDALVL